MLLEPLHTCTSQCGQAALGTGNLGYLGNEHTDQLTKKGAFTYLFGPEPAYGRSWPKLNSMLQNIGHIEHQMMMISRDLRLGGLHTPVAKCITTSLYMKLYETTTYKVNMIYNTSN